MIIAPSIIAPWRLRRIGTAAAALPLALALVACGGGGGRGPDGRAAETAVVVRVTSGQALLGVNVEIHHATTTTVVGVTPASGFAGATCADNPEVGFLRVACFRQAPASAPFDALVITFAHAGDDPGILDVTCTGAPASGAQQVVACTTS